MIGYDLRQCDVQHKRVPIVEQNRSIPTIETMRITPDTPTP